MQEENREKRIEEPQEVVNWYVRPNDREVVDCYVQPRPMPVGAAPMQPPAAPKKAGKKGLRIFLIAVGVLLAVIVAAVVVSSLTGGDTPSIRGDGSTDGEGGDASSIVDIFRTEKTTIPRMQGEAGVSMTCTAPSGEKLSIQDVYAKVNPSTVLVVADRGDKASIGTGVIMTSDGYIITNAHVISGGKSCWIALDTGYTYDVRLVGYDEDRDLAVLKAVDAEDLPVAEFGDSGQCRVGDTAYAIGNPLGVELRGTLTNGIISAINRDMVYNGHSMTLLQTNAAINEGNSGGPLINMYGQVIGITNMKALSTGVEGIGFAIPTASIRPIVNALLSDGRVSGRVSIGITVGAVSSAASEYYDLPEGLYISAVAEGSDAEKKGIQSGDMLLAVNGQAVTTTYDVSAVKDGLKVGDTVTLTIYRDGKTFDVDVRLVDTNDIS